MKLEPRDQDEDIEVDMSPMIDMVFLLLIFFLVAATAIEIKVPVTVPDAAYSKVPENVEGRFVIAVDNQEQVYAGMEAVDLEELEALLEKAVEDDPELRVQIRSDGEVKYSANEEIMEVCAKVGIVDMIFSAFEE